MKYLIVYEKTETGYSAYLPDLPGCIATGRTKREVERNMRQALEMHIDGMKADGEKPAKPKSFIGFQEVSIQP